MFADDIRTSPSHRALSLVLLRGRATGPAAMEAGGTVPWWITALLAVSGGALVAGAMRTVMLSHPVHAHAVAASLPAGRLLFAVAAGAVGRVVSVFIQAEAAISLGGHDARETATRKAALALTFISQLPIVAADLVIGFLAIAGYLSARSFLALEGSPFNPFLLWSCVVFARSLRSLPDLVDRSTRIKLVAGFSGYLYVIKLAIFGLSLAG